MSLHEVLRTAGFHKLEGNSSEVPQQQVDLRALVTAPGVQRVLEIGFNAGHSSEVFLSANPTCEVVSFDLGSWAYTAKGKEYIDQHFPGRHTLILGDSTVTVPKFCSTTPPPAPFDLLFIDGGHYGDVPRNDLENCLRLTHPASVIILDDTNMPAPGHAWKEALDAKRIQQTGVAVYTGNRRMNWGVPAPARRLNTPF